MSLRPVKKLSKAKPARNKVKARELASQHAAQNGKEDLS